MGIDMYLYWDEQTDGERDAQITGFRNSGADGYLREAYWGGPYGTSVLAPESWGDSDYDENYNHVGVPIPAATLAGRMEAVAKALDERWRNLDAPERAPEALAEFVAFVELAKAKERELGKPCRVYCSY